VCHLLSAIEGRVSGIEAIVGLNLRGTTLAVQLEHDALTLAIRAVLTPDLLRPEHHQVAGKPPTFGHSYVAAEAYYHLAGGAELGLTVYHVRHEGTVHWWLQLDGVIIDPTGDQFTTRVPYEAGGRAHFLPPSPSARARTLMARIAAGSESV